MAMTVEDLTKGGLRALFKVDVNQDFFQLQPDDEKAFGAALQETFADLHGRFGVKVLGTLDDDLLACGQTFGDRCVSYILAEIPSFESAIAVTNLVRTRFMGTKIARFIRIEARVGRALFFGNE